MSIDAVLTGLFFACGVICAKWAMDLGLTQLRQLLWALVGLVLGPLGLFILYLRLLRQAPESARRWV